MTVGWDATAPPVPSKFVEIQRCTALESCAVFDSLWFKLTCTQYCALENFRMMNAVNS